jgi:hypothetical protein
MRRQTSGYHPEVVLRAFFECAMDVCFFMGPAFGYVPPVADWVEGSEDSAGSPVATSADAASAGPGAPLSRAERRQWRKLVTQLGVPQSRQE